MSDRFSLQPNCSVCGADLDPEDEDNFPLMMAVGDSIDLTCPKWPKEMSWGILENRQYFRSICGRAILYHENKEKKEAEELYRLLLKLNPNDNQGVRYLLSALYANKHPELVDQLTDEGNKKQDWSELEGLLKEQNKKYHFWKYR